MMAQDSKPQPSASSELEPSVREHGVWGTKSDPVGSFGESYDAQVAHGAEPGLPSAPEDLALAQAVRKALAHAHIDAADVRVTVQNAQVTLSGSVHSAAQRSELDARARSVPGVSQVACQLAVLDEPSPR